MNTKDKIEEIYRRKADRSSLAKVRLAELFDEYREAVEAGNWTLDYVDELRDSNDDPELLAKVEDFLEVKDHYTEALHGNSVHKAKLYFKLGKYSLLQKKDYMNSIELLSMAIENDPCIAEAYYYRGTAKFFVEYSKKNRQDISKAILSDLSRAIELNPEYVPAYCDRGAILFDLGEIEEALKEYSKAIEIDPENAESYNNRGLNLLRMGNLKGAFEDFSKAIDLDLDAYNDRGIVLAKMGHPQEALRDFSKAIELDRENAESYSNRGLVFRSIGQQEKALRDFSKAIELKPEFANAHNGRGLVFAEMGYLQEALKNYSKAIELDPEYASAYSNRGVALGQIGKKEEALRDFSKAIELDPADPKAYNNRGVVLREIGLKEDARKYFSKALDINPNLKVVWENLEGLENDSEQSYIDSVNSNQFAYITDSGERLFS